MKIIREYNISQRFFSNLLKGAYLLLALLVIGFAVLVTLARLATPYVNKDMAQIETYLSEQIGKPVHIGKIDMWWSIFGPTIKLENLMIDKQLEIKSIDLDLNLIDSIYERQVIINDVVIMGGAYTVVQLPDHGWLVNGVRFSQSAGKKSSFLDGFFSFSHMAIRNVHIDYIDLKQHAVRADIAYLHLNNTHGEHSLSGLLNLLEPYRVPFRFNLTVMGDVHYLDKIHAKLYVKTSDLLLSRIFPQKVFYNQTCHSGFGDAELWLDWQNSQVQQVQAHVDTTDLQLFSNDNALSIPRFSANLAWAREKAGWLFSADHIILDLNHHSWPISSGYFEKQANETSFGVSYLSLADLRTIASHFALLTPQQAQQLSAFNPNGELSNLILLQNGEGWSLQNLSFSSDFKNISLAKQDIVPAIPAVKRLSGQISWQKNQGSVFINSRNLSYTDDNLFASKPLVFQQAYLDLNLQQLTDEDFSIGINNFYVSNQDLRGSLQGLLQLNLESNSSSLSLLSIIQVNQLEHLYDYMPVSLMKPKLKEWMGEAFQGGDLTATTLFKGSLADFPFSHSTGIFLSDVEANQVKLRYSHEWPILTAPSMTVNIVNDSLTINTPKAFSRKIIATNVSANIPAMTEDNPNLQVNLTSADNLKDMLDIIDHSSLSDTLGQNLDSFQPTGLGVLNLQLNVPLDDVDNTAVKGQLKIHNGSLSALSIPNSVRQVSGEVDFTDSGLTIKQSTALIFDHPGTITADTIHTNSGLDILNFHVEGLVDAAYLQSATQLPLTSVVTGVIPFKGYIIRVLNAKHDSGAITVQAESNLKGVTVALPGDLMKPADIERNFKLQLNYFNEQFSNIKMAYADLINFDLDSIGVSDSSQSSPEGFSVAIGLKQFDWSLWQAYFLKQRLLQSNDQLSSQKDQALKQISKQYHNKIVNINAQIGQVKLYNQELNNVALVLQPQNNSWDLHIASDHVTGDCIWPLDKGPIIGRFDHLYLQSISLPKKSIVKKGKIATASTMDLSKIPPIKLTINNFSYSDKLTGRLLLDLSRLPQGLSINDLEFISKLINVKLTGKWLQQNQIETTSLAGTVSSDNISEFFKVMNIDDNTDLNLSTGKATFSLNWRGAPYEPSLKNMVGDADLNLGSGNIVDIGKNAENKLNFGRLLNALSVQSIVQKLTMNFNDYKEGYDFTSMEGNFNLNKGDLYTKHTQFNGPVAAVGFSGHVDIIKRNFNLLLFITPHVTGSVPVVAGLLINPAVGVAAWFANLLFSPAVGQAVAQEFQMTGSWDKPNIVSLTKDTNTSKTTNKAK